MTGNKSNFFTQEFDTIDEALEVIESLLNQGYDNAHVTDTEKLDIW